MIKAMVLGGGLVGGVIAGDLAEDDDIRVSVADINDDLLRDLNERLGVTGVPTDLSDPAAVRAAVADQDIVIGAAPGALGYRILEAVIEAGRDFVDISFMPEDFRDLDEAARQIGVTALVDMGVAPGMSHVLVGRAFSLLDETERAEIMVGGLPVTRLWPYEYKLSWSPLDVLDEYVRPARVVESGRVVEKPALSDLEAVDLPGVGTLEAFNTDGLRSLLTSLPIPHMKEKTLRYPGHAEKMRMLRETGFFSFDPVDMGGAKVRPVDLTAKLMFPKMKLEDGERELTVMRVTVEGRTGGRPRRYTYDALFYTDPETGRTSMSRATGYPCAIMARMIARGEFKRPGVRPPEDVGRDPEVFGKLMAGLEKRGILFHETVEDLG